MQSQIQYGFTVFFQGKFQQSPVRKFQFDFLGFRRKKSASDGMFFTVKGGVDGDISETMEIPERSLIPLIGNSGKEPDQLL